MHRPAGAILVHAKADAGPYEDTFLVGQLNVSQLAASGAPLWWSDRSFVPGGFGAFVVRVDAITGLSPSGPPPAPSANGTAGAGAAGSGPAVAAATVSMCWANEPNETWCGDGVDNDCDGGLLGLLWARLHVGIKKCAVATAGSDRHVGYT